MKRLSTFVFILLATVTGILAQTANFVPNPGFETFFNLPTGEGDIYEAVGWDNLNGGSVYPNATPDYFHSGGTNGTQLPNTYAGDIFPMEGNALAGFITYNFFVPNFREYIGVPLTGNLEVGKTYDVSFWLSNSQGNSYGSQGTNNIGVAFSIGAPSQSVNQPINLIPQVEISTITYHSGWVHYTLSFTATDGYDFMTIGNFRNDANTQRSTFATGFNLAYYFIDLVSVQEVTPLAIEDLYLSRTGEAEGIEMEWRFPNDHVAGEWSLERSTDQVTFHALETFTAEGNELAGQEGKHYDETAFPNVQYYYRMRHVNTEGEVEYSDLVWAQYEGEKSYVAGNVFPNPMTDRFSLEFASAEGGEMQIEVVDQLGKTVYSETRNIELGEQVLGFEFVEELSEGIYIASFVYQGDRFTRRLVAGPSM